MKKKVSFFTLWPLLALIQLISTSCTFYRKTTLDTGQEALIFRCTQIDSCYDEIKEACGQGFEVIKASKVLTDKISLIGRCL